MIKKPQAAATCYELLPGIDALPPGVLHIRASGTLVAADVHFAYEDVIGGALPLWSTEDIVTALTLAAQRSDARELVLLGDVVHGAFMSEGAANVVREALNTLAQFLELIIVAGNHEGRTRAKAVLGDSVEALERDGWHLMHGDRAPRAGTRSIIGHLHPSLHMGGHAAVPAFLASDRVIVLPALTPYSSGLSVCSDDLLTALEPWDVQSRDLCVVAAEFDRVYPFGSLSALKSLLHSPRPKPRDGFRRKFLRPDVH